MEQKINGQIVDVVSGKIFGGTVFFENGVIKGIVEDRHASRQFILPGFVDAHVHIESSMIVPTEFAKMAVVHGTVATVSDPHEIANVCGIDGVNYMLDNAAQSPFYFNFGAPSCVPATSFETAGATLNSDDIAELLSRKEIKYLSEMMNYPGVLFNDEEVMRKITTAHKFNKPVDGHAPGLRGKDAQNYAAAGITTDHECYSYEEAKEKIGYGMKILIREGSAAKNYDSLIELMGEYPDKLMFCSDDKHPDSLVHSHINELVTRSFKHGFNKMDVLRVATLNPTKHYGLEHGLLQVGDSADFIVTGDLEEMQIKQTWLQGILVAENGKTLLETTPAGIINQFNKRKIRIDELLIRAETNHIKVIEALNGQLITNESIHEAKVENGFAISNTENDILKMVVVNRYTEQPIAFSFVKGFGFRSGSIASTVAHDSHNIIAIGVDDESLCRAINLLVENKGGISLVNGNQELVQGLPVAGLMSNMDGYRVATTYTEMDRTAKGLGSGLGAPFMTLSFLALLVIPQLKLSDKGLFDGGNFKFTKLFV